MIIYKDKALAIINSKNIPKLWLIFGTDAGEIDLMVKKIIEKVKSESSELITLHDHSELYNSVSARSLFHLNKIIVLSGITDLALDTINNSINLLRKDDYCILKGGDLKKTSKLIFAVTYTAAFFKFALVQSSGFNCFFIILNAREKID